MSGPRWLPDGSDNPPNRTPGTPSPSRMGASELGATPRREGGAAANGPPKTDTGTSMPKTIYQLKVTLLGTEPPIWRRVLVDADLTLAKLAAVINAAMGWDGYHIHEFRAGKEFWGPPLEPAAQSEPQERPRKLPCC